jgi:hypothetical protein
LQASSRIHSSGNDFYHSPGPPCKELNKWEHYFRNSFSYKIPGLSHKLIHQQNLILLLFTGTRVMVPWSLDVHSQHLSARVVRNLGPHILSLIKALDHVLHYLAGTGE